MQQNLNLQHNHGFYLTEEENPKSKSSVVPHSLKDNICIYGGLEDERERERERERGITYRWVRGRRSRD
jgi:hypothetical protein